MQKGRFLSRVISEMQKYHSSEFKKYMKPIINIQDNILSEARKGKICLEIPRHIERPIREFFVKEGFSVYLDNDPDVTEINWESSTFKNKT